MRIREDGLEQAPVAFVHIMSGLVRGVLGLVRVEAGGDRVEADPDRVEADPDRVEVNPTSMIQITHPRAPQGNILTLTSMSFFQSLFDLCW
ncbi:unnamed protein product [Linum tenue]|uniref:Uncharacterized protein n=1 Tax=Linum tenue TaxID=586396 RepID=A0AAV0RRC2_9ROSI|nr:unnamed protein product [Linum tenue]